ncbi:DedA family protein [Falsirhodobacter deserti]|uniref:DedA family protein n=1 Tax=Falsirhodobacter deserti TaxID=1365611 RepID=UPI000FE378B3|nr:DedA family protein [Falsirhodobacter deserti]
MFDFITGFLQATGIWGVAIMMFMENVFPPIPSELIMPLAGFNVANGSGSLWATIAAGTVGSLLGLSIWYWVALKFGLPRLKRLADRTGRFSMMDSTDIDKANGWFERHGGAAVLFGRLLPTIRTVISIPAGLAFMPFWKFLIFSAIGTFIWTALLTLTGYILESQYDRVQQWLNPISTTVVLAIIGFYLWGVITYPSRVRNRSENSQD